MKIHHFKSQFSSTEIEWVFLPKEIAHWKLDYLVWLKQQRKQHEILVSYSINFFHANETEDWKWITSSFGLCHRNFEIISHYIIIKNRTIGISKGLLLFSWTLGCDWMTFEKQETEDINYSN